MSRLHESPTAQAQLCVRLMAIRRARAELRERLWEMDSEDPSLDRLRRALHETYAAEHRVRQGAKP